MKKFLPAWAAAVSVCALSNVCLGSGNAPNGATATPSCNDVWTATRPGNTPEQRALQSVVWTGSEMIVWGGADDDFPANMNTGGRYNPDTDNWIATSTVDAPAARQQHTAVWTGTEMIIWGGFDGSHAVNTGARYNPTTDSWVPLSAVNAPAARAGHTAVWTGSVMIVWGGSSYDGDSHVFNTGATYDPATDSWTVTSITNAPTLSGHTAVWTGNEMIVWGGFDAAFGYSNTGGKYDPHTDSWAAVSTVNAPSARSSHLAVWTGSQMIVWGGGTSSLDVTNTGGRYDPTSNSWMGTSTINAPAGRAHHVAVWTGSEMIIWAGRDHSYTCINTGARYEPTADVWAAISTIDAPGARADSSAVWTGNQLIVWGGDGGSGFDLNSGGRYCAIPGPYPTPTPIPTPTPTTFGFVPGNYYSSESLSRVIKEYDGTRNVVASFTVPAAFGEEVKGLAFGADGLLYAAVSLGFSGGFTILALRSDGSVSANYDGTDSISHNASVGKIALDNQYLYVCGGALTRFRLGDPLSGTMIHGGGFDVKPLPNGHLLVASGNYIDEITTNGEFVRRIELVAPGFGQHFLDIRGLEYDPQTNVLFVSQLGTTDFSDKIMRVDPTTGELLSSTSFIYPDDMFLDSSGNLLVGSDNHAPMFFSQDLGQENILTGGNQTFVTQYRPPAHALNISTRMQVDTGSNVLIGGFIITGNTPKSIAVRGIGPSLTQFGIPNALADPTLTLRDSANALVQQNDDWQDDSSQASQLMALGLAPQDAKESALISTLSSGAYTATLVGKDNGTGVGLMEIYDTESGTDSQLDNISTRGFVLADNKVMIGGFILGGNSGDTYVAARGIGPSLAQFGISPVLADPTLELHDANGAIVVANNNWQDDSASASQLSLLGLSPSDPNEAAIVRLLSPGAFTAILSGNNGGTGIGLVEIYNLH